MKQSCIEQDAEDEWETVPTKSKGKKHAADGSAASSPNNLPHGKLAKADSPDSEDDAPPAAMGESVQQQLGSGEHAPRSDTGDVYLPLLAYCLAVSQA